MDQQPLVEKLKAALAFAEEQVRGLVERTPDYYPMYTVKGKWKHDGELWTRWCDGFLPGMMWIFHERTGDPWWRQQAERYSRTIEDRKDDRDVHDLGFLFYHGTYLRWYQATQRSGNPDETLHEVVKHAGRTLAMRFKEKGKYLRSFVADESLFIDIMMNVGLIFHSALETGNEALMRVAMEHSLTSRRVLVREDGSTAHEAIFDTETGEYLRQSTHQGYGADSCWARGLAWSLYGFATCFKLVKDPRFLTTSQLCADYYMEHTPPDGIPPWDYHAPAESRRQVDSSAAAIAASGLLELADVTADRDRRQLYRAYACRVLDTLCEDEYLGRTPAEWEGILKHGVYHLHKGLGVDESVMWGEFFFVEALDRCLRLSAD